MFLADIITQLRNDDADFNDVADALQILENVLGAGIPFVPELSGTGLMEVSSAGGGHCRYWKVGRLVIASYYFTDLVIGGSPSSEIRAALPITASSASFSGGARVGSPGRESGSYNFSSTTIVSFARYDSSNYTIGSDRDIAGIVVYESAA